MGNKALGVKGAQPLRYLFMGGVSTLAIATFAAPALSADEAPIATAAAAVAPAAAQDQPASSSGSGGNTVTEVVVTGLRGSLQKSLNVKKNSIGVVDAISAEDIGKFPDSNLAQAMERISGVTVTRGATTVGGTPTSNGDATQITVRGFGPTFNETLYDGRQISSAVGDRSFDFSAVGSDFVSQIDVMKTPDATLSSGAIGATVNIKFAKPFDHMGPRMTGSFSESYSPEDGHATPNGSLLLSNTFAHDTLGVLLDVAYSDQKTRGNHVNVQGWEGVRTNGTPAVGAPCKGGMSASEYAGTAPAACSPNWFIQDYGIYQEHSDEERFNGRGVVQWRPASNFLVTLNDDYSRDRIRDVEAGVSWWFNSANLQNVTTDSHGTITNFTQPNSPTDFQGQVVGSVIENNETGLNAKWDVNEKLKLEFDADHAESWLNPGGQLSSMDADVGYGDNLNNTSLGVTGISANGVPYPVGYGPNGNAAQFNGNFASNGYPGAIGSHVLVLGSTQNYDAVNQAKFQATWSEDHLRMRAGVQYLSDKEHLKNYGDIGNGVNDWQAYSGYGPASGNATGVPLNPAWFADSYSTSGFINGMSGNLPPQVMKFNGYQVLQYLQSLGNPKTTSIPGFNSNCGCTYAGKYEMGLNPGSVQVVNEETASLFVDFAWDGQVADMPLKVAFGAREEHTRVKSVGLQSLPIAMSAPQSGDPTLYGITFGPTTSISKGNAYNYLLPNLDVNLMVTPQLKLRFDASRTLTRPPLADLTPSVVDSSGPRINALTGTSGNPTLLPYLSDNLDFGAEWYYQKNSYLAADFFVKDITNFLKGSTYNQTLPFNLPGTTSPAVFIVSTEANEAAYQVRGLELTAQHVFGETGFGFQANATLVDTNHPYNPADLSGSNIVVPGLADSWNFVGFYDKYGFQARIAVNWHDDELQRLGQTQNNSAFGQEPTFTAAATYVDFSTSYQINPHLDVYFEAMNLTDQAYVTHGRYANQILDAVDTGRRFNLGFHFKM